MCVGYTGVRFLMNVSGNSRVDKIDLRDVLEGLRSLKMKVLDVSGNSRVVTITERDVLGGLRIEQIKIKDVPANLLSQTDNRNSEIPDSRQNQKTFTF